MYEIFLNKIGKKFNVVNGEFVEDSDGILTVSTSPFNNSIYLNTLNNTWLVVSDLLIGIPYRIARDDCATLCARYLDKHFGSKIEEKLFSLTLKEWTNYIKLGGETLIKEVGGYEVNLSQLKEKDVVSYEIEDSRITSHLAVYLGNNKILHHVPNKYSSIDDIDMSKVKRVFRYGN
jgi:hypothetical protein